MLEQKGASLAADHDNRLRNVLSVVRSIVRRTAENSKTIESFAAHLEGRIDAYARLITYVGATRDRGISLAVLVAETLTAFGAHEGDRLTIDGPDIRLHGKTAESLGFALHELATNAVEHGAVGDGGKAHVSWKIDDSLQFTWRETGTAPVRPVEEEGFGFTLLHRALPFDLGANVQHTYGHHSLTWEIEIPKSAEWETEHSG
jgi:two-component system CheB/CheR fusion protein